MAAYVHDTSFFSRRAIVFVAIVGFHVLFAWMLTSGLARKVVEVIAPPIETNLIEELETRDEPPPPPPPEFERLPIEIPPPDVTIDIPMDTQSTAITDVTTRPMPKGPPAPPPPRKVTKAAMGKNFPNSNDFYPPSSIRLEEQGSATIRACVGPDRKLVEAPTLVKSSGSGRLDEAAIKLAKAGSGRYVAGSVDGVPSTDCFNFAVKFKLH